MSTEQTGTSAWRELLQVEDRGIEPVPAAEQTSGPGELFWIWFAGNISILGLPLGIWVVAGELNLWQALLAGIIGSVGSFAIVGIVSIAGQRGGAPSLTLSRAVFGQIGNFGPTIVAILSRWGWETVNTVTAAYAVLSIGTVIVGHEVSPQSAPALTVIAIVLFLLLTLTVSGLGHRMLAAFQKWATYIFGALTLVVIVFIVVQVEWNTVLSAGTGSWSTFFLGIGVVAAGTGLAWANSGADIGRYQSEKSTVSSLILSCAAGAGIPLVIMIGTGSLIGIMNPDFDADNPLASIPALLPPWMSIPFLISAFAGLLLSNNISVYSSGLTLLTLGIKTRRIVAVMIELGASLIGSILFLFVIGNFYGPFIGFITLLAIPLTAWLGVFLVDMIKRTWYDADGLLAMNSSSSYWYSGGVEWRATAAWLIAIIVGFSFKFAPLSETFIAVNGLEWLVTLILSGLLYAVLGGAKGAGTGARVAGK
ncbi:MAG: cytosine permease [Actinomycetaceae bacterium]|nr:cytosine permease [Actinomycetaceae bacterium]